MNGMNGTNGNSPAGGQPAAEGAMRASPTSPAGARPADGPSGSRLLDQLHDELWSLPGWVAELAFTLPATLALIPTYSRLAPHGHEDDAALVEELARVVPPREHLAERLVVYASALFNLGDEPFPDAAVSIGGVGYVTARQPPIGMSVRQFATFLYTVAVGLSYDHSVHVGTKPERDGSPIGPDGLEKSLAQGFAERQCLLVYLVGFSSRTRTVARPRG